MIPEAKGKLIIFSAPSGAGKTTIVKRLLEHPDLCLEFSISAASRPKRANETNGKDYYFITAEEFRKKIANNEFVEWQEVYPGSYYGTLKSEMKRIWDKGNNVLFDVDVQGGLNLKKIFGNNAQAFFITPPSLEILAQRLKKRGTEDEASLKKRLDKAEYEMTFAKGFDQIIVNDNLERAVEEAIQSIKSFLARNAGNPDQTFLKK